MRGFSPASVLPKHAISIAETHDAIQISNTTAETVGCH
jgi:hypothetical protein